MGSHQHCVNVPGQVCDVTDKSQCLGANFTVAHSPFVSVRTKDSGQCSDLCSNSKASAVMLAVEECDSGGCLTH